MTTFAEKYGPWAVVAGASNGIGLGYAQQLAARDVGVVLVSRSDAALAEAEAQIVARHPGARTRRCVADLTAPDIAETIAAATDDLDVGALVYNAGAVHGAGLFHERPVDDAMFLVHLNCRGPVVLSHHFARRFVARGSGGIVLMSSMAALAGSGYVAAYSATKAFDINLAEGLAVELAPHGVDVLAMVAGATDTPALAASGARTDGSAFTLMDPEEVAREALDALGTTSFVVAGDNKTNYEAMRSLPRTQITQFMTQGSSYLYDLPPLG